jgi:Protein of unknown function (DUF2946)
MKNAIRKFVAILMLLWLPLSSASAQDMMVSMQAHGSCHNMAMPAMQHQQTGNHHALAQHNHACTICGACHLACSGYLQPSSLELAMLPSGSQSIAPFQVSFVSFIPAPLDPPPLARS